jgi:hypothetical protein
VTDTPVKIPKSVTTLPLYGELFSGGYRAFIKIFEDRGRVRDPSIYIFRSGDPSTLGVTYEAAVRLHHEGVFGEHSSEEGDAVFVNEHALHALQDFCADVYDAWRTFETRLEAVSRHCPNK